MSEITQFDEFLSSSGPAALVIREQLAPVDGAGGVVFPATFAAGDNFAGGYNIDGPTDGKNVCLIDSVGSQANRLEPLFKEAPYSNLVPQVVVKAGEADINLLDAGHRAGDAIVRSSELQQEFQDAFKTLLRGNAEPLAKVAPTSLVFGVWDSRDTQAKLPRVINSTIRAFDVRKLTRGAVYAVPVDYSKLDVFSEDDKAKAEADSKNPLAQRGFVNALASASHGGVIADGGIRRDAVLSLTPIRSLQAETPERTTALRRYIFGLALTAFTHNPGGYLRQGCLLVLDADAEQPRVFSAVYPCGKRDPLTITHDVALSYATKAAAEFGVGLSRAVNFDKVRAVNDVKEKKAATEAKAAKKAAAKKAAAPKEPEEKPES